MNVIILTESDQELTAWYSNKEVDFVKKYKLRKVNFISVIHAGINPYKNKDNSLLLGGKLYIDPRPLQKEIHYICVASPFSNLYLHIVLNIVKKHHPCKLIDYAFKEINSGEWL